MPFVRKTDSQGSQQPTDARKLFIGRTGELLFFVQNILKPEEPTHNIISIWGQGGVGKSTLLSRFIDEARSADFKDYCLTARVDELQTTHASMMEKFANQLHIKGEFQKALKHYKEMLRTEQTEPEMLQDTLVQRMPVFAGAAVEGVPFVGPLLGEGVKATAEHLLDKRYNVQRHKDAELLEDPLNELTRTFVDELNRLTETQVMLGSRRLRKQRLLLFFDTFEQLAVEAAPWLLNYFLPADIKSNVVLVIAGRDPIERSIPDDTKRWLPYIDNADIYWIPLNSFTEDETRAYLIKRDITDPERISTIWQLSQGLPLYLSLLTSNPRGKVDPTAGVVANFLRWIPMEEQIKRQLALDAALFSRPFTQDDLEAFTYLPEKELPSLYHWLVGQPFIHSQDGRYSYHDLARELLSRHLYQDSRKGYYAARRALVDHYRRLLREIKEERGSEVYRSAEWLELVLALIYQLFSLPDEVSHIEAVEQALNANERTNEEQDGEIIKILHELSQEQRSRHVNPHARQLANLLLQYIETGQRKVNRSTAIISWLETIVNRSLIPTELLASLYYRLGRLHYFCKEYLQAIDDYDQALDLNSSYGDAYSGRGWVYSWSGKRQQAIDDFNHALELDTSSFVAYNGRGWAYLWSHKYQEALADFDHALKLDPTFAASYNGRGVIYQAVKEYEQALLNFNCFVEVRPKDAFAYLQRGNIYISLREYQRALADFDHAINLDSNYGDVYFKRGLAYLWLKNINLAKADFSRNWERDQSSIHNGWLIIWAGMCQERPDPGMAERLEKIAAINSERFEAYVCRGVAMWLREYHEKAIAELERAIQIESRDVDPYFWKGMVWISLGQEEEALEAIEKALEQGLPPILLTPLRWFEQDKPDFYQKYVVPLMARNDLE